MAEGWQSGWLKAAVRPFILRRLKREVAPELPPRTETVLQCELSEDELKRWYVQFGSTLRNVGEYAESVAVLSEGHTRFTDDVAIACFLALAQHSAGEPARALRTALEMVLAESAAGRIDLRRAEPHLPRRSRPRPQGRLGEAAAQIGQGWRGG